MKTLVTLPALAILAGMSGAMAQTAPVPLASYADDNG